MKKILITSTDVMMLQFLTPHVFYLQEHGYEVEVACSNVENHIDELIEIFEGRVKLSVVTLRRSPLSPKNFIGFSQLKSIIEEGHFDYVWTNEPVMGVMTRLAASLSNRKVKPKILYVAHGFHFFRGASLKNWMIFYPIEKVMSYLTDEIITINHEDYEFAQKHFCHPKIQYFPGIGINTTKFLKEFSPFDIAAKRGELGIKKGETFFLSVGELEVRKNHATTIKALSTLKDKSIKLFICGVGTQKEILESLIKDLSMENNVFLLGYRYDINELCHAADAFVFFTYQEGLSVALMEAMSVGTPCIISKIRGNVDLVDKGMGLFADPHSVSSCSEALAIFMKDKHCLNEAILYNQKKIKNFDIMAVKKMMLNEIANL